jgi:hypothetical protein
VKVAVEKVEAVPEEVTEAAVPEAEVTEAAAMAKEVTGAAEKEEAVKLAAEKAEAVPELARAAAVRVAETSKSSSGGVVAAPQRVPTSPRCSPAATAASWWSRISRGRPVSWPRAPPRIANEVMGARA